MCPNMVAGQWTGTMNLTEPHCGTDLGLLKTQADPNPDGSYSITGTKIFISSGEHDLAENIIHLVLAKIAGRAGQCERHFAVRGARSSSSTRMGRSATRNGVTCGSIEHKMGIHGNSTCVLNYDGAKGWLVGEPEKGLAAMFIMMNAARLGVGLQGLAQGEVAYQNAVAYAKDRRQGRALKPEDRDPDAKADNLFVHPDVRRMLMEARAFNEAARALILWGALQVDLSRKAQTEEERLAADDLISLMTPVIKGYLTDHGFEAAVNAQQVFGGHGYIREWGMEQFVRDARIAQIYEGTNGVQAMDLVGRKLAKDGGRAVRAFFEAVGQRHRRSEGSGRSGRRCGCAGKGAAASAGRDHVAGAERHGRPEQCRRRRLCLHAADGPRQPGLDVAQDGRRFGAAEGPTPARTRRSTRPSSLTARFFAERELVAAGALRRKVEAGAESVMALPVEAF